MTDALAIQLNPSSQPTVAAIVQQTEDGRWSAQALGWLDYRAEGATREQALQELGQLLTKQLAKAEIVHLAIPSSNVENPLMKYSGMFKDDPQFDQVLAEIESYRHELDAERAELTEHDASS